MGPLPFLTPLISVPSIPSTNYQLPIITKYHLPCNQYHVPSTKYQVSFPIFHFLILLFLEICSAHLIKWEILPSSLLSSALLCPNISPLPLCLFTLLCIWWSTSSNQSHSGTQCWCKHSTTKHSKQSQPTIVIVSKVHNWPEQFCTPVSLSLQTIPVPLYSISILHPNITNAKLVRLNLQTSNFNS